MSCPYVYKVAAKDLMWIRYNMMLYYDIKKQTYSCSYQSSWIAGRKVYANRQTEQRASLKHAARIRDTIIAI